MKFFTSIRHFFFGLNLEEEIARLKTDRNRFADGTAKMGVDINKQVEIIDSMPEGLEKFRCTHVLMQMWKLHERSMQRLDLINSAIAEVEKEFTKARETVL